MRRRQSFLIPLISIVLGFSAFSHAQNWSGILSSSRAIDWSTAGVTGGIPNRTTICATLNPGATAAQINSAISSCGSGQVVKLNAGTYNVNGTISLKSNVTLRGSGASTTKLNFTGASSCFGGSGACMIKIEGNYDSTWWDQAPGPQGGNPANIKTWTGTNGQSGVYTRGATVLNLSSAPTGSPNLQVDDLLFLFQNQDSNDSSNGALYCESTGAGCSREGSFWARGTIHRQAVKVVGISGTQVTISPGLVMDTWRTSQSPRVYWWGSDIRNAGIEDLFVEGNSIDGFANISFFEASDCWMKGVASHELHTRNHVTIALSRNITVQDSYMYQGCTGGCAGAATGYGVEAIGGSSFLVQNNVFHNVQAPILLSAGSTSGVMAYNYEIVMGNSTSFTDHEIGNVYHLYEGNAVDQFRADTYHGTHNLQTTFRNYVFGGQGPPVDRWAYSRFFNDVGNVLKRSGGSVYECTGSTSGNCGRYGPSIFRIGYPGEGANTSESGVSFDDITVTGNLRWGNYDTVTGTSRFQSSEVPSGSANYPNAVPGSQTLPASFYLNSKPNWWPATKAWPPIGPDVTGGNISGVGGHAYTIPANDCYTAIGGNISNFNAATCYLQQPGPDPPSDLSADVQ